MTQIFRGKTLVDGVEIEDVYLTNAIEGYRSLIMSYIDPGEKELLLLRYDVPSGWKTLSGNPAYINFKINRSDFEK